jgi:hypothetical protein
VEPKHTNVEELVHDVINKNLFLVKEHVGLFKAANNFDIYDPVVGEIIMAKSSPICQKNGLS